VEVHETITNPTDSPVVVARLRVGATQQAVVLDTHSHRGATYDHTWQVATKDGAAAQTCAVTCDDAILQARLNTVTVEVGFDSTEARASHPDLRTRVFARVQGPEAEVLLPARDEEFVVLDGFPGWIPANAQHALRMTVTAADGSAGP